MECLFTCNHLDTISKLSLICDCNEDISLSWPSMLVSSANINVDIPFETYPRSFTYKRNKRGPRLDPWGTLQVMYVLQCRVTMIISDILQSVWYPAYKPQQTYASNLIIMKFHKWNIMIYGIKGLGEIQEYSYGIFSIFSIFSNSLYEIW